MNVYGYERGEYRESEFTAPRHDCPHPERWTASDPDSTEQEVSELVSAFVRAVQPDIVVETGAAFGETSAVIGEALKRNGQGKLFALEPDAERAQIARDRCLGLPVEIVEAESLSWSPAGTVGFAWFDSLLELRVPEFLYFSPWLEAGTIVGFHDCGPHRLGFRMQLEALAGAGIVRLIMPATPRGVCFAQVL